MVTSKKSGFVSIVGNPNVGKSSLLNALIGEELSIVTTKPQTTRNNITGIYTNNNIQIVFLDTPGMIKPHYELQKFMKKEVELGVVDSDIILFVIDSSKYDPMVVDDNISEFKSYFSKTSTFCVLNKVDLVKKEELLHIINDISKKFDFKEIFPVSAKKKFNINELLESLINYLPFSEFYYDSDDISAASERFLVSEIIRGEALNLLSDEVPYSTFVKIDEFVKRAKGKDFIKAEIILDKETHKKIFIGHEGQMLRKIGTNSRKKIEKFVGKEIFLRLFVKVRKNWKDDKRFLKSNFQRQTI